MGIITINKPLKLWSVDQVHSLCLCDPEAKNVTCKAQQKQAQNYNTLQVNIL